MATINNCKGQGLIEFLIALKAFLVFISWLTFSATHIYSHVLAEYWLQEYAVCREVDAPELQCEKDLQKYIGITIPWYKVKIQHHSPRIAATLLPNLSYLKEIKINLYQKYPLRRGRVIKISQFIAPPRAV